VEDELMSRMGDDDDPDEDDHTLGGYYSRN
jgi:hypothetical protein